MPVVTGVELVLELRVSEHSRNAYLTAIMGLSSEDNYRKATESGVDACVKKPFVNGKLLVLILTGLEAIRRIEFLQELTWPGLNGSRATYIALHILALESNRPFLTRYAVFGTMVIDCCAWPTGSALLAVSMIRPKYMTAIRWVHLLDHRKIECDEHIGQVVVFLHALHQI